MKITALGVIDAIHNLKTGSKRGPAVCLISTSTSDTGLSYQGMIEDWSIDLHTVEDLERFGAAVHAIYNIGEWS
jgi:hypothetical protein